MSYRDPQQELEAPLLKIIRGIDELGSAIDARLDTTGEWKQDHLEYLIDLRNRLIPLKGELQLLEKSTW